MTKVVKKKLSDLSIDVIEPKEHHTHPKVYHKILPQHEFSMLIVAPKGSGKTNLLCNFILKHYKGYFHRIIVCSPTVNNDDKWDVVQETKKVLAQNKQLEELIEGKPKNSKMPKIVHTSEKTLAEQKKEKENPFDGIIPKEDFITDLDKIVDIIKEQQETIQTLHDDHGLNKQAKYVADRMLIILDDQAGMFKQGNTNNPMANFVIKHRHSSSSVIIVTQAYKAIPKTIRTNCNALILFEIPNLSELKVIYEENPEGMSEPEWMKVYKYATDEAYSFLYINNKFPKGQRVFKKFQSLLQVAKASSKKDEPLKTDNSESSVTKDRDD